MLTFHVVLEKRKTPPPVKGESYGREIVLTNRRTFIQENGHQQLHNRRYRQGTIVVETNTNGDIVNYACSFCSNDEQFVRKVGRGKAICKLLNAKPENKTPGINGIEQDMLHNAVINYVKTNSHK